jgi:hypothetical protein
MPKALEYQYLVNFINLKVLSNGNRVGPKLTPSREEHKRFQRP